MTKCVVSRAIALLCILSLSLGASATTRSIGPQWLATNYVIHGVSISDTGWAEVGVEFVTYDTTNRVDLTVTLQKAVGALWKTDKTWTTSGTGGCVELDKGKQVTPGSYRVMTVGKVYSASGSLIETVTVYSSIASC